MSKMFLRFCEQGNLPKIKEFIEKGVDVNEQNEDGDTAAHIAIASYNVDCLEALSQVKHINWNLQNNSGATPAIKAVQVNSIE